MGKINVLSFAVANLIAAGEVVDRPASVIKELLENAIDSGADRITVEIQNGGITFMRVSDNGCGMEAEDLPVAIRRHATSKIRNAEDLDGIMTLGFRGEALAAIASVSHMRIISKTAKDEYGAMLDSVGGEIKGVYERACSQGTTVIVEDLFANVPARRKFLKKDITESTAVCSAVEKIALSKSNIAFKLIVDGNIKLETIGDSNLKNTIYSVFGRDFTSRLLEVKSDSEGIKVEGFVGRSDNVKANRNYQNFFINGRYVKSKTATAAIEQAYTSYLFVEKFPVCVLNIEINPATVDVNVHPAKLEVKFSNEKTVFEAIYYAVRNTLEENVTRPPFSLKSDYEKGFKTRVSDMRVPIANGEPESVKSRQIGADLYTAKDTDKRSNQGGFVKMTAEEYAKEYVGSKQIGYAQSNTRLNTVAKSNENTGTGFQQHSNENQLGLSSNKPAVEFFDGINKENAGEAKQSESVSIPESATAAESANTYVEIPAMPEDRQNYEPNSPISEAINQNIENQNLNQEINNQGVYGRIETVENENTGKSLKYRIVGEVFNSYVIVELEEKMLLIDKHAAHERVLFETLKARMYANDHVSQLLMIPVEVMMTSEEVAVISEYRAEIEAVGFEFTCGKYTVSVSAIPEEITLDAVPDMLAVIAERLKTNTGNAMLTRNIIFEKALFQASCKAAIKGGREYPPEYIEWLVTKMMQIPDITFCPHGRPVAMELTKHKIDHQFERC